MGVEQNIPASTSSSVVGAFSFAGKQPKKLELKEKIFNDFFKAFVVKPQTKVTDEKQGVLSQKESNEAEYANLKNVYNQTRTSLHNTSRSNDYDNFYQQKESNYWSKNMEKILPNSQSLQEMSSNVILILNSPLYSTTAI